MLKLRIDYGSILVSLASEGKTEELRNLYDRISKDELSSRDWLGIFKAAAENGEMAISNIGSIAIKEKKEMTLANWMGIFAYAALKGDNVINSVQNMIPSNQKRKIVFDESYWSKVIAVRTSIIKDRDRAINSVDWVEHINENYPLMTEEQKLQIPWEDSDLALSQYCRSPNISIGQICMALISINSKILEVNKLFEGLGDEPIDPIIVRIPKEIYQEVVDCLKDYLNFSTTCRYVRDSLKDQVGIVDILLNGIMKTLRNYQQPAHKTQENAGYLSVLPPEIVRIVAANLLNPKDSPHR